MFGTDPQQKERASSLPPQHPNTVKTKKVILNILPNLHSQRKSYPDHPQHQPHHACGEDDEEELHTWQGDGPAQYEGILTGINMLWIWKHGIQQIYIPG